ncbi:MAG: methyltransferase cognate corrinoid protein [Planctomycetota bacterium]|nr:MAG: methyltransferase cognate corrinoid protein [Planctomycetota bacterium]
MDVKDIFAILTKAIVEGDSEQLVGLVKQAIDKVDPLEMVEKGMAPGMTEIGSKFGEGQVYLPELLMAAEAWEEAMKIIKPRLIETGASMKKQGTVVIGTVQTDIHEIGKNILANLLTTAGFDVHDIGCDAPATKFLNKAEEVQADIIAASAIMSTTVPYQKDIIDLLESKGLRDKYVVMVGGGVVSQDWADKIGADGYGELASDGVQVAKKLISQKKGA